MMVRAVDCLKVYLEHHPADCNWILEVPSWSWKPDRKAWVFHIFLYLFVCLPQGTFDDILLTRSICWKSKNWWTLDTVCCCNTLWQLQTNILFSHGILFFKVWVSQRQLNRWRKAPQELRGSVRMWRQQWWKGVCLHFEKWLSYEELGNAANSIQFPLFHHCCSTSTWPNLAVKQTLFEWAPRLMELPQECNLPVLVTCSWPVLEVNILNFEELCIPKVPIYSIMSQKHEETTEFFQTSSKIMCTTSQYIIWLVVWNMNFTFPFSWECHHPNWLSVHHFSEG